MVGSTAKHGTAMEQVIEYRMVTSLGEIISITEDNVYVIDDNGAAIKLSDDDPRNESHIFFGLRGAGASFGIVTGKDFCVQKFIIHRKYF